MALVWVLVACNDDPVADPTTAPATTMRTPTTAAVPSTATGATTRPAGPPRLNSVGTFSQPVDLKPRPGDDTLFVVEKGGVVRTLVEGTVVLDISDQVSSGSEQGLLGMDFSPDGAKLYINYTDTAGDTHVEEFAYANDVADAGSRRELLFVDQPFANHNGGSVVTGPDGMLYLGLGDGGSAGDPRGNAQSLSTHLGKILRISPAPSGDRPYTVPPDNPFVGREGTRPEIWSYGLRNPWRFSFDRDTRELWIGDVGQNAWEEIDRTTFDGAKGANFGWDLLEGTHAFEADSAPGTVLPVYEFENGSGNCSVTGGFVYRGRAIPALMGSYIFADYCAGDLIAFRDGRAEPLDLNGGSVSSFGQDNEGEIYVLSLDGEVAKLVPS